MIEEHKIDRKEIKLIKFIEYCWRINSRDQSHN